VYLLENDLPKERELRDRVILAIYGSPDRRQIDGLGGADSLTSKVAIIGRSSRTDADVDYTFGQVSITEPLVDHSGNCGNISSGVGPFAIDEGLVKATEPVTRVRIFNTNTQKIIEAQVPVVGGKAAVKGDCVIPGVPGSGARIQMNFIDSGGAMTGGILPTGQKRDVITLSSGQELTVSIVDAANPCVFARASDLGVSGTILPPNIDGDADLSNTLEEIRSRAGEMIGLVDDWRVGTKRSPGVPKMIMVSDKASYTTSEGRELGSGQIDLVARAMSMQKAHKAYPISGTIGTGVAANIEGTLVNELAGGAVSPQLRIGHPAGVINVEVSLEETDAGLRVQRAVVERTARRILSGYVYVPLYKLEAS
jgi:2-methylaconitate cis-trans-isomerase PrpF